MSSRRCVARGGATCAVIWTCLCRVVVLCRGEPSPVWNNVGHDVILGADDVFTVEARVQKLPLLLHLKSNAKIQTFFFFFTIYWQKCFYRSVLLGL